MFAGQQHSTWQQQLITVVATTHQLTGALVNMVVSLFVCYGGSYPLWLIPRRNPMLLMRYNALIKHNNVIIRRYYVLLKRYYNALITYFSGTKIGGYEYGMVIVLDHLHCIRRCAVIQRA